MDALGSTPTARARASRQRSATRAPPRSGSPTMQARRPARPRLRRHRAARPRPADRLRRIRRRDDDPAREGRPLHRPRGCRPSTSRRRPTTTQTAIALAACQPTVELLLLFHLEDEPRSRAFKAACATPTEHRNERTRRCRDSHASTLHPLTYTPSVHCPPANTVSDRDSPTAQFIRGVLRRLSASRFASADPD